MYNYEKLMAAKPTIYDTITNCLGQKIDLMEHPSQGDLAPVIAVSHELKLASDTDFFDTEDLHEGSDYNPIFKDGKLMCEFEL